MGVPLYLCLAYVSHSYKRQKLSYHFFCVLLLFFFFKKAKQNLHEWLGFELDTVVIYQ